MPIYFVHALTLFNVTSVFATRVMLALYALSLDAQPIAVGFLAATFSMLPMLLSWPAGRLVDRYGCRWFLLASSLASASGMLVPYFVPGLPALYLVAGLTGFSFAFYNVSMQNLVGLLSTQQTRTRNYSNWGLVMSSCSFFGPLLAGLSIDYVGHANSCLFLAGLALVPAAMVGIWGQILPGATRSSEKKEGGAGNVLSDPGLWRLLVITSLVVVGVDLFQFYIPIYGHGLGLSASAIGIILAASASASFVVRMVLPHMVARLTAERVLAYSFAVGAASYFMVPFFDTVAALALVGFIFGLGMGCGQPVTIMLTFSNSASGRSAEILGLRLTAAHLARVVGPIVFGSIGTAFGLFPVFWANALLLAVGGLLSNPRKTAAGSPGPPARE